MAEYNYAVFDLQREEPVFAAFPDRLHVGEQAPVFSLEDLGSGETVSMKSLWAKGPAILEFGSYS